MRMLLDRSTRALARILEPLSKPLPDAGPAQGTLVGLSPKPIGNRRDFISAQRGALLALVRSTNVEFLNSRIGYDEGFRVAQWPDSSQLDIFSFHDLSKLEWAKLPFDFAKIPGFYDDDLMDVERYRTTLAMAADPRFLNAAQKHPSHFGFSREELKNLHTYRSIISFAAPRKEHLLDLFQLWTAEVNHIEYFLTCDKAFIRFMTQTMKSPFRAIPALPSTVCEKHTISFQPLQPANEEDFYTLGEDPLRRMIEAHDRGDPPPRARDTLIDE